MKVVDILTGLPNGHRAILPSLLIAYLLCSAVSLFILKFIKTLIFMIDISVQENRL